MAEWTDAQKADYVRDLLAGKGKDMKDADPADWASDYVEVKYWRGIAIDKGIDTLRKLVEYAADTNQNKAWIRGSLNEPPPKLHFHISELHLLPKGKWLYGDIVPSIGTAVIYGSEGSGKSFYALHIANQIAESGQTVLYVPIEDVSVIDERETAYLSYHKLPSTAPLWIRGVDPPVINNPTNMAAFKASITELNPRLIIVDTFRQATRGLEENSAKEVGEAIDAIRDVVMALECAFLIIHHTGKDKARGARGSSVITSDTDVSFEAKPTAENEFELLSNKNRFAPKSEPRLIRLVPHANALVATYVENLDRKANVHTLVLNALTSTPQTGYAIAKAIGKGHSSVANSLRYLEDKGRATQQGKGWVIDTRTKFRLPDDF